MDLSPDAVPSPADDPGTSGWRPSALAFLNTLVLLGAFTRMGALLPYGASDETLQETEARTMVLVAGVALVHAIVAAAAARMRRVGTALALLLATTAALPLLVEVFRWPIHSLLLTVAPSYCAQMADSCPPDAWSPLVGALVGALLAPIVVTAVHLRDQRASDVGARMLWITGLWTGVVAVGLRVAHLASPATLALAATVALGGALLGLADTSVRWLRLRVLLRGGRLIVRAPRGDEAEGLRPYASLPRGVTHDAILCVDEVREASPYRAVEAGRRFARAPKDVTLLTRALAGRMGRQAAGLAVLVAALALAAAT